VSINESASPVTPLIDVQSAADRGPDLVVPAAIDPNDPPWGIPHALIVWVISVVLIVVVPLLLILPYIVYRMITQGAMLDPVNDTILIFISILAVLPAHILTLVIVWLVVTSRGRRPFLRTLGWTWPINFGPVKCIGLAVLLLIVAVLFTWLFGGAETQLDQIVKSSLKARFVLAFLAVFTAPLVEEVIYRGIMYPALQRAIGTLWAVATVSILLPCFVIHLVFNGLQALFLVFQPLLERYANQQKAMTALFIQTLPRFLP
jgi:uncharacterized protein